MPDLILVLGMHRSGTSALTRVLALAGARLPDDLAWEPLEGNPTGYWEPRTLGPLHDKLLAAFDRTWADPRPLPSGWVASSAARRARREIDRILDRWLEEGPPMVVKDPRLCHLAPLWLKLLDDRDAETAIVLPLRAPAEVARSLHRRDGLSPDVCGRLWLGHVLAAEAASRGRRRIVIRFEDLVHEQTSTCHALATVAGLPVPSANALAAIAAFVDASLYHHHAGQNDAGFGESLSELLRAAELAMLEPGGPDGERLDALRVAAEAVTAR